MTTKRKCTGKGNKYSKTCGKFTELADDDYFFTEDHKGQLFKSFECSHCGHITDIEEAPVLTTLPSYTVWNHERILSRSTTKIS